MLFVSRDSKKFKKLLSNMLMGGPVQTFYLENIFNAKWNKWKNFDIASICKLISCCDKFSGNL